MKIEIQVQVSDLNIKCECMIPVTGGQEVKQLGIAESMWLWYAAADQDKHT